MVYENNDVYVGGEEVGTASEFAQTAAVLATVDAPPDESDVEELQWMPLGTFAVVVDERQTEPSRVVQLAVNQDGIVSGTIFNADTDQTQTVQGQVDFETQRVAVRVGDNQDVVVETGLYNLTLEEAPVLVHFGPEEHEDWLLIRLEAPESDDSTTG